MQYRRLRGREREARTGHRKKAPLPQTVSVSPEMFRKR
jgi:hypothetical protein